MKAEKEQEIADEIAKSKEDTPVNAAPIKKEVKEAKEGPEAPALPPTPADLPPELAGALPQAAANDASADYTVADLINLINVAITTKYNNVSNSTVAGKTTGTIGLATSTQN